MFGRHKHQWVEVDRRLMQHFYNSFEPIGTANLFTRITYKSVGFKVE